MFLNGEEVVQWMPDLERSQYRRQFLRYGLTGSFIGLAGCSQIPGTSDTEEQENTTTEPENLGNTQFSFNYDNNSQRITITYQGGAQIAGGDLQIRTNDGKQVVWSQVGSTTADIDQTIQTDATAVLGPSILNWNAPVESSATIRLVYVGQDSPATLGRFTPSETTTELTTTVPSETTSTPTTISPPTSTTHRTTTSTSTEDSTPPSVRALSVADTGSGTLRISFDSDERLSEIQVRIGGAESAILTTEKFTANQVTDGGYTYEATFDTSTSGTFSITLESAVDAAGNNGAQNREVSITTDTEGSNPVASEKLLARWQLESGFNDSVGGHDATVDQGNPQTGKFAGRKATSFHGSVGARISRGGHGELSLLGEEEGPASFSFWVYFDSAEGGRPYDSDDTASHTLIRNDTGYIITGSPAENANGVDIGFRISSNGSSPHQKYGMPDSDNVVVSTEAWHHIAVTVEPKNTLQIFVDGERRFSDDSMQGYSEPASDYWSDLTLGSWYGGNSPRWANILNGKLADFRIYRTRLSPQQVTQIYNNQTEGGDGSDSKSSPIPAQNGLAYSDNAVYGVTDSQIVKYDFGTEKVESRISAPNDSRPSGLAYGDGSLWFADAIDSDYNGKIVALNPETGAVKSEISTSWDPRGLAFGDGSLWVIDITGNRVVEFSPDGTERGSFSTDGVSWGQGLAYADGSIWVGNNCSGDGCTVSLREYDTDGTLVQKVGQRSGTPTSAYGGLAATDSELLGPGKDGSVTVLRTLNNE